MFKVLLERGAIFLLVLILITQLILPLFVPKLELFWIFKRKTVPPIIPVQHGNVDETLAALAQDAVLKKGALDETIHKVDDSIEALTKVRESVK